MKLDYGNITSPYPIPLTIGTIRKPTLGEIADPNVIGFYKFAVYQSLLILTPQEYYQKLGDQESYYFSLSDEEKSNLTMFRAIEHDENLQELYTSMFNLFFIESVIYNKNMFVILEETDQTHEKRSIKGLITEQYFWDVLDIIGQICMVHTDDNDFQKEMSKMKFKNKKAKKIYEKMHNTAKKSGHENRDNINFTIPNIISAVCARHPSINYINVYQLTVCQLWDIFNRLREDVFFDITKTRASVWGDEKNVFNPESWYKNKYDGKKESA